jgi:hypothetical protein
MLFRGKKISNFTTADIQSLIDNKVPESKILDYKREIKFDEASKTELIYDVDAFYNTEGGVLIIGLDEELDEQKKKTGIPKLPESKITVTNYDQLILRVEEMIKQSTNPQITNLQFSKILSVDGSDIFIIGIPKAKTLPAMVTYSNHNRFFKRKSNGKYTLDTYELYDTFLHINVLEEKIEEFLKSRHLAVSQNEFWGPIGSLHSMLMHLVPIDSFNTQIENFPTPETKKTLIEELKVPGLHSYSYRYCLEGFHLYCNRRFDMPHEILPYNLFFRNAVIESFTNEAFYNLEPSRPNLYTNDFLKIVRDQIENAFNLYRKLSIDFPFYLSIKLNNTKNLALIESVHNRMLGRRFEYENLVLPIVLLSNESNENKKQIKNVMDILWQAFGNNECSSVEFNSVFDDLF